jgi:Xaa-Pro aminopeptidase
MFMDRDRAQAILRQERIDVLLSTRPENLTYVSGFSDMLECRFWRHQTTYALIFREDPPALVVPWFEVASIRSKSDIELIIPNQVWVEPPSSENPTGLLEGTTEGTVARVIGEHHLTTGRIGIDEKALPKSVFRKLQDLMPEATFVDATRVWEETRLIKTPAEISRIEKAVRAVEEGYLALRAQLQEGVTERELTLNARDTILAAGADDIIFDFVTSGPRTGIDHVTGGDFAVQAGEIVKCDISARYDGYCGNIGRTFACGEPSAEQARINKRIVTTNVRILAAAKPGVLVSELYGIYLDGMREGYGDTPWHVIGHSVGVEVYDSLWISPSEHRPLQPGMVISLEIGYLDPGQQGQFVEDDFVITEDGNRLLSILRKDL